MLVEEEEEDEVEEEDEREEDEEVDEDKEEDEEEVGGKSLLDDNELLPPLVLSSSFLSFSWTSLKSFGEAALVAPEPGAGVGPAGVGDWTGALSSISSSSSDSASPVASLDTSLRRFGSEAAADLFELEVGATGLEEEEKEEEEEDDESLDGAGLFAAFNVLMGSTSLPASLSF